MKSWRRGFANADDARVVLFHSDFDGTTARLENAFPALSEALGDKDEIELDVSHPRVRI